MQPVVIRVSITVIFIINFCVGLPLTTDDNSSDEFDSSESAEALSDQAFPFNDMKNESSNYMIIDDMVINKDILRAGFSEYSWPDGVVPYSFQYTILPQQRQDIMQAMKEISEMSCVKFRPVSNQDTYNIEFRNSPGSASCTSFVGWQNRKNQPIQLSAICSKGNAIHEILHALGFLHEQTRDDRDDYVIVNYQNIQPGAEHNFKKDSDVYTGVETSYFDVPYNFDSIMHYGRDYFSKNGAATIEIKNPHNGDTAPLGNAQNLGQRDFISYGDKVALNKKYNCKMESQEETGGEDGDSTKPTTKNSMCQYNPTLPMCKS